MSTDSKQHYNSELKNILEAAILVAGQPLTIDKLSSLFPESSRPERDEIKAALEQLSQDYAGRGIELKQVGKSYRIQSKEKYSEWLQRLSEERPQRYSRALMETLAVIAYRQPVTRGDIEEIRGVSVSTDIIRTLTEREWVRQVGQRDVPGKPALYGTTKTFLEYFNLKGLEELPTLAEMRDLEEISKELNLPLDLIAPPQSGAETGAEAEANVGNGQDAEAEANAGNGQDAEAELDASEAEEGADEDMPAQQAAEAEEDEVVEPSRARVEGDNDGGIQEAAEAEVDERVEVQAAARSDD